MILTYDYIGGAEYIDRIIKHHPPGFGLRILINASGWHSGLRAMKKFLKERQDVPFVGFHGQWDDYHVFKGHHVGKAVAYANRIARLKEKYPDMPMFYSPFLEPNSTKQRVKETAYKRCRMVLEPYSIPVIVPGVSKINEWHGTVDTQKPPYIFSFDGLDMLTELHMPIECWKAIHSECLIFSAWIFPFNGKKNRKDTRLRQNRTDYPRKRHFKQIEKELLK